MEPMRALTISLMLAPLVLSGIADSASAAPSCPGGVPGSMCVEAIATAAVSCSHTATTFSCTLDASYGGIGSTATPLPGRVGLTNSYVEIAVCDGFSTVCVPVLTSVEADCGWGFLAGGCTADEDVSQAHSGAYNNCFVVSVYVVVEAGIYPGPAPVALSEASEQAYDEYTNCP